MSFKINIDNSLKAAPFLGTLLVLSGIVKADAYYSMFNIEIKSYLTFGESLILFFDDILFNLFLLFLVFVTIQNSREASYRTRKNNDSENPTKSQGEKRHFITWIVAFAFLLSAVIFILEALDIWTLGVQIRVFLLFVFRSSLIFISVNILLYYTKSLRVRISVNYLFQAAILLITIKGLGENKAALIKTKSKNLFSHGQLVLKDRSVIDIDSTKFYLGKTNSVYIYYDIKERKSIIVSADEVSKFIISEKNYTAFRKIFLPY